MSSEVKKETMRTCLSCPLCDNLLHEATTISECLHSFCRKCIYEKITEDEIECCPVCNIDLGGSPLEKLRPDHNLQDLRAKIFPLKRKKVKAPEIVSLPAKRKERSISSLVVNTPKVSEGAETTGRRTNAAMRKELQGSERTVKKEECSGDDLQKDDDELWDSKLDLWKPLNFLVEVANRTKPLKSSTTQGSCSKSYRAKKTKTKDHKRKCSRNDNGDLASSETVPPKRLRRTQRKRFANNFDDSRSSPQSDELSANRKRRNGPVWFSLVASNDKEGETSLPQIPANFLRIRNGNIPVSFIQKYLMKKLDLESETEIEIRCMEEVVTPTLKLDQLVDLWLQTSSTHQRFAASIGSSAKDYMMVLVYARKPPDYNN